MSDCKLVVSVCRTMSRVLFVATVLLFSAVLCIAPVAAADVAAYDETSLIAELGNGNTVTLQQDITLIANDLTIDDTVILDLNGHILSGTGNGPVITLEEGADFTLIDSGNNGQITGGYAENGGGVCVNSGNFTMYGGTITGNTATNRGGGIYATYTGESFTYINLYGGEIARNSAGTSGGGVWISSATNSRIEFSPVFNMILLAAVYIEISGGVNILENTVGASQNNLHFNEAISDRFSISRSPEEGKHVGITVGNAPTSLVKTEEANINYFVVDEKDKYYLTYKSGSIALTSIPYTITWYVNESYHPQDTMSYGETPIPPDESSIVPPATDDPRYVSAGGFAGWANTPTGEPLTPIPSVTKNTTYYAVFADAIIRDYTLTWNFSNGTKTTETKSYGSPIVYPDESSMIYPGHEFVTWDPVLETMPASDITIAAVWNALDVFTVTIPSGTIDIPTTGVRSESVGIDTTKTFTLSEGKCLQVTVKSANDWQLKDNTKTYTGATYQMAYSGGGVSSGTCENGVANPNPDQTDITKTIIMQAIPGDVETYRTNLDFSLQGVSYSGTFTDQLTFSVSLEDRTH